MQILQETYVTRTITVLQKPLEIAPRNFGYFILSVMPITGDRLRPGAIPSGFCNTVIVLVTESGMFPAVSASAVYV